MKKIIPSFLLAVSVSSSLLLAQDKNNNKTISLSEDQIDQGAQIATNYELPTANCNNQGANLDCYLMMDPVSAEEVGKSLQEKVLSKEAPSEVQKPADAFHEAVARKAARADEDIICIKTAQERVEEAASARSGFVELVKNDVKNRSAFIEELQKIWTSDIISTSSEIAIKLVADSRYEALKTDLSAINAKANAYKIYLDKELKAYEMAETAWSETVIACERGELVIVNNNQALEELTLLHNIAAVRTSTWIAHIAWVQARKTEVAIKNPDHITEEEADAIETAWGETVRVVQATLEKLNTIDLTSLRIAEEQEINTLLAE
ncbi:MAG TPA: hypothetical protein VJK54_04450, partial [Chthoniobacterales bacterium]|nr:hypothetical protein [Chthoniobacterales bacterium]